MGQATSISLAVALIVGSLSFALALVRWIGDPNQAHHTPRSHPTSWREWPNNPPPPSPGSD